MSICLDAKVSFKLVMPFPYRIQTNSAWDESNILISSVTDTFSARKPSTEPEISHMLLYLDLHLLSFLCQQKYLIGVWSQNTGFVVLLGAQTACQSASQPPGPWGQVSAATWKPKANSCRMKRWNLPNTVKAPVNTLSNNTLVISQTFPDRASLAGHCCQPVNALVKQQIDPKPTHNSLCHPADITHPLSSCSAAQSCYAHPCFPSSGCQEEHLPVPCFSMCHPKLTPLLTPWYIGNVDTGHFFSTKKCQQRSWGVSDHSDFFFPYLTFHTAWKHLLTHTFASETLCSLIFSFMSVKTNPRFIGSTPHFRSARYTIESEPAILYGRCFVILAPPYTSLKTECNVEWWLHASLHTLKWWLNWGSVRLCYTYYIQWKCNKCTQSSFQKYLLVKPSHKWENYILEHISSHS